MSDQRFTKIIVIEQNKWLIGCPVEIVKGALLLDTLTQNIILQLKLRNVSTKVIKQVDLLVYRYDIAGDPIPLFEDQVPCSYVDLTIKHRSSFGDRQAISMGSNTTRKIRVVFTKVVFENDQIWRNDDNSDGQELALLSIDNVLGEDNANQFDREYSAKYPKKVDENSVTDHKFIPQQMADSWICTCGFLNTKDSVVCGRCDLSKDWLFQTVKTDFLSQELIKYQESKRIQLEENRFLEVERKRIVQEKSLQEKRRLEEEVTKRRKLRMIVALVISAVAICIVGFLLAINVIIPNLKYNAAKNLMDNGDYDDAQIKFEDLDGYKDSSDQIMELHYIVAKNFLDDGKFNEAISAFEALNDYKDSNDQILESQYRYAKNCIETEDYLSASGSLMRILGYKDSTDLYYSITNTNEVISAEFYYSIGVKSDGSVIVASFENSNSIMDDVSAWTEIVAISTYKNNIIGLKSDGRVLTVGSNNLAFVSISDWKDIIAISAGGFHFIGLKNDGTVVAIGGFENESVGFDENGDAITNESNNFGQCDVNGWTDIVAISAGYQHTVGLKKDGTVVAVGSNNYKQCDVTGWTDIVAVSAGDFYTIGLKSDGTVVAAGWNINGQCDVSGWSNIMTISAGYENTVGIRKDKTLIITGKEIVESVGFGGNGETFETKVTDGYDVTGWTDIVAVSIGYNNIIGLKENGTALFSFKKDESQFDVSNWTDIALQSHR